jgi:hypothetical protein
MAKGEQRTASLTLRVPVGTVERADRLVEWAATQPDLAPTGRGTRTDVLRAALVLGLEALARRERRGREGGE